jgi:hypothetical protein
MSALFSGGTMSRRLVAILVVIGVVVAGAYYGSPHWTMHQLQAAARAGEGDRLARYVDFPAVRESIKTQLQTMMIKKMQNDDMKANPFAAMGMMLAGGMVNMLVDGMVTPEGVATMVNSGKAKPPAMAATPFPKTEPSGDPDKRPRIERHYDGLGVFKVEMHDPQTDATTLTLVLNREGWFDWKLKAVRFAALAEN